MHKGRGYKIRVERDGDWFPRTKLVWGIEGVLPNEWRCLKYDESVRHAELHYNAGSRKRGRLLDEYIRPY